MNELHYLITLWHLQRLRLAALRDESGYTTEMVIIVAALAFLALAVTAIIASKVLAKAESIPTD